jgi:hypothetical protein
MRGTLVARNPVRAAWLVVFLLFLFPGRVAAQAPVAPPQSENVKVFIDCVNVYCDSDFLRTEITFIDHVRDRKDADVHVLVTGESTGGGGTKYTVSFIGQKKYAGVDHLLEYVSASTSTGDEIRRGLASIIKMGLIHYVAGTRVASEIQITRPMPKTTQKAAPARDPWNYWFFRTSLSASVSGEKLTNRKYVYTSLTANRITDAWKTTGSLSFSYSQSHYTFSDGSSYTNYSRSANTGLLLVKSLSPHWSAGGRVSAARSTYLNEKLLFRVAPAIEYDLYPYSESTRRQLTFNYSLGASHFRYEEETIYDKMRENLASQVGVVSLNVKQPWGTIETQFEASQYLNAGGKNHLEVWNSLDIRLFKGFSFNTYGSIERLHDQIYLAKAGATPEEVLVQRRQLATSYSYYVSFGFSYSFGSIHNNIVNSRFYGI